MRKMSTLRLLTIPVPRPWLFFGVASLWTFGSIRVFMTGWQGTIEGNGSLPYFIGVSGLGAYVFTRLVFTKVTSSYISHINSIESLRPSLFLMFRPKSYLLMAFMITLGIVVTTFKLFPIILLSMFLGSLGISLFVSAMHFLRAWGLSFNRKQL